MTESAVGTLKSKNREVRKLSLAILLAIIGLVDVNLSDKMIKVLEIKEGIFSVPKQFPDSPDFFKCNPSSIMIKLGRLLKEGPCKALLGN